MTTLTFLSINGCGGYTPAQSETSTIRTELEQNRKKNKYGKIPYWYCSLDHSNYLGILVLLRFLEQEERCTLQGSIPEYAYGVPTQYQT